MSAAWLDHWVKLWPHTEKFEAGMRCLARLLRVRLLKDQQPYLQGADVGKSIIEEESESVNGKLAVMFRRSAFQPAAAGAYLAIIASDLFHIRSDLMQRLLFQGSVSMNEEVTAEARQV